MKKILLSILTITLILSTAIAVAACKPAKTGDTSAGVSSAGVSSAPASAARSEEASAEISAPITSAIEENSEISAPAQSVEQSAEQSTEQAQSPTDSVSAVEPQSASATEPQSADAPQSAEESFSFDDGQSSKGEDTKGDSSGETSKGDSTEPPASFEDNSSSQAETSVVTPTSADAPTSFDNPSSGDTPTSTETPSSVDNPSSADNPTSVDNPSSVEDPETPEEPEFNTDIKLYKYYTEELPSIYINTEGGIAIDDSSLVDPTQHKGMMNEIPVYNYVKATISVTGAGEGYELNNVSGQVKVRGNYTSTYEKKPIRIKFDKKQKMAGLNNGTALKSWVLLAEYKDSSMLRNSVAFYLGNALLEGHGGYASDFRYVKVYMNGSYHGLYLLAEQQQVNKNRVNIAEPEDPEDYDEENLTEEDYAKLHNVHIGYLVEYDGYYNKEPELEQFVVYYNQIKHVDGSNFTPQPSNQSQGGGGSSKGWGGWGGSSRSIGFSIKSDVYFEEQRAFIEKCMQTIWNVIWDAAYGTHTNLETSPYHTMDADGNYIEDRSITTAYEAIDKVVDIKSLVDMYILQEICEDMDISWSSFFMSLDMSPKGNRKLTYNAPWDFDSSLGSASGDTAANNALYGMMADNPWLVVYSQQDWFWKLVNDRFNEADKAGVFEDIVKMIDDMTEVYADAYAENYARWPRSIGRKIESQQVDKIATFRTQADASAYLKTWFTQRINNLKVLFATQAGE